MYLHIFKPAKWFTSHAVLILSMHPNPSHIHSFKTMLSTVAWWLPILIQRQGCLGTVMRRVLRQRPSTAEKASTINLPGAQEGEMTACISQVGCHSVNLFRSKSPLCMKLKRAINYVRNQTGMRTTGNIYGEITQVLILQTFLNGENWKGVNCYIQLNIW